MSVDVRGNHRIMEYWRCCSDRLNNAELLERVVADAAREAGGTVLHVVAHRFSPQGVTVVVVLAESHCSVHTWPDEGYAAADYFSCGKAQIDVFEQRLGEALLAKERQVGEVSRGQSLHWTALKR